MMQLTKHNLKETLLNQSFQIEYMKDVGILASVMNHQGCSPSDFFEVMTHLTRLKEEKDAERIWNSWAKYKYGIGSVVKLLQKYNGDAVEKPVPKSKQKRDFNTLLAKPPKVEVKKVKEVVVERTREEMMAEYLANNTIQEIPYGVTTFQHQTYQKPLDAKGKEPKVKQKGKRK